MWHPGKDIPVGTPKAILPSAGLEGKGEGAAMTYTVVYEKGPTSSGGVMSPDLPGVISVGDSRDEVEQLIQEAIAFHLEGMRDEGREPGRRMQRTKP